MCICHVCIYCFSHIRPSEQCNSIRRCIQIGLTGMFVSLLEQHCDSENNCFFSQNGANWNDAESGKIARARNLTLIVLLKQP